MNIQFNLKNLQVGGGGVGGKRAALFPFPPTSRQFQLIKVTSGFTRLSMKTKYVCRGLISLYGNFHNNRTMWSTNLQVGEKEKEPKEPLIFQQAFLALMANMQLFEEQMC